VRGIVREENGFLMAETESKLRAMVREEFKVVREELRPALGISEPNATLKGALADIYVATARTLIEKAPQKVKSTSPLSNSSSAGVPQAPTRSDWVDIGRLSVIEGTLNSLEVLCKTRADSDSLREAENILLDVKGMMEGLKVTGTNIDHKADALRSMLASLPATQPHSLLQPFMHAHFPNPWHPQFTPQPSLGGTQGIQNAPPQLTQYPPSGAPTPSLEPPVPPVPPAVPAVPPPKPTSTQAPPAQASAASKKQDDSLSVAIRASVDASRRLLNKDGLPKLRTG
jgi:hypothetical protein